MKKFDKNVSSHVNWLQTWVCLPDTQVDGSQTNCCDSIYSDFDRTTRGGTLYTLFINIRRNTHKENKYVRAVCCQLV